MKEKKKVLVIVGPTGVGKTALSIELALKLNGEIINGDSMQVYRGLDIGTAKVTRDEMLGVPHHLLDICNVFDEYTASDFKQMGQKKIDEISHKEKIPIIVGGTGLYIEGLLFAFHFSGSGSNDLFYRQEKEKELQKIGAQKMWEQLQALDPDAAKSIHVHNTRRVIRALEVIHATGKLFSSNDLKQRQMNYDAYVIGLSTQRTVLYERINQRVLSMVEKGLEEEAAWLYQLVKGHDVQSIRGIGYKEWIPYFEGEQTKDLTIATIQQQSRRYAKRQLTWFRNRLDKIQWYDLVEDPSSMNHVIADSQKFLLGGG